MPEVNKKMDKAVFTGLFKISEISFEIRDGKLILFEEKKLSDFENTQGKKTFQKFKDEIWIWNTSYGLGKPDHIFKMKDVII